MGYPDSYFEDEVREGFYVPGMIKRSWAMQLDVLAEIEKICDQHGLKWFAEYGTMIGAARHHGFIPWDDDLDIGMFREDYDRFWRLALEELPKGYRVLNIYTSEEYDNCLTRITCTDAIELSKEYLDEHNGFPYVAGVDIFPMDYVFADENREQERRTIAKAVFELAEQAKKYGAETVQHKSLRDIEEITGKKIDRTIPLHISLLRIADGLFASAPKEGAKEVAAMYFWIKNATHRYPLRYFDSTILLPFEGRQMNMPVGYSDILSKDYGSWWKAVRSGGIHDYPFFREQEQILLNSCGELWYKYIPLSRKVSVAYDRMQQLADSGEGNSALSLLKKAENWVADENMKQSVLRPDECGDDIVFLIAGGRKSALLEQLIMRENKANTGKVTLVIAPIFSGGIPRDIYMEENAFREWAKGSVPDALVLRVEEYDFENAKPRKIFFQVPHDEYNSALSVDSRFYSYRLRGYTQELIYVPLLEADDFGIEDSRSFSNMDYYVETPGVYYADRIILSGEIMKTRYIDYLSQRMDSLTKEFWESKIEVIEHLLDEGDGELSEDDHSGSKALIFHVSIGDICVYQGTLLNKIADVIKIFELEKEHIRIRWIEETEFENNLKEINSDLFACFKGCVEEFKEKGLGEYILTDEVNDELANIDGFYGSAGFILNLCAKRNIPSMIMNPDVKS